jgi:hypothetical protein
LEPCSEDLRLIFELSADVGYLASLVHSFENGSTKPVTSTDLLPRSWRSAR